ncbi:thiolase C-terminal domain-containing protein [Pollutimonas thiosulfatoxidans]|uniref:Acetyl-CoA acetyltransferase n=1 Tax=Pollutimonas thiosulfatoxidans TaxID=2028345 RepID=A0A410GE91_9BURK|nr:thiolase family protein [Pollutimonas thiosulfatoxidans]QAA94613.1 acetyl-CoA acetyltransferase [Pollutimonas thiosulfatoxidans]
MDVFVIGMGLLPAQQAIDGLRLEEMAYQTARAALDHAGVKREQIDHVTLAASDEIDARGISSMLLAAPSGAYLKDEMRVTDSAMTGLQLGAMRAASGELHLGLVVSTVQVSASPLQDIARMRAEPFFLRPIGMNLAIADGLLAGALMQRDGLTEQAVAAQVHKRLAAAQENSRAVKRAIKTQSEIADSAYVAHPLRADHCAPLTDGAVAMVLASGEWVRAHPECRPLARIAGISSTVDRYQLDASRLTLEAFEKAMLEAVKRAGLESPQALDVVELEAQTGWADLAMTEAVGRVSQAAVSPSGGAWAQNPYFCTSMINAAEAVLQVCGSAGTQQVAGAKYAMAHGISGFAQQAHNFMVFEGVQS